MTSITATAASGIIVGSATITVTAAQLVSIAVTPASPSIAKGLTQQFTATGMFSDNSTQVLSGVSWASSSNGVATINGTGLATGVGVGTVGITAQVGSVTSPSDTLTVTTAQLVSIAVTPASPSITKGLTQQFTATGTFTDNSTQLLSNVTWASSSNSVATINSTGLATGVAAGTTGITASQGSVNSPSDTLTVTPVSAATVTAVSVSWGTSGSAALQTATDGLRLLPAGRSNDLPWMGINKISITLSAPATLANGDVSVTSKTGANYGPVTVSGSGTSFVITLAQPINTADRVTFTIGNANIATYTRRLDVLPGDVNDDGIVTLQDALMIRNAYLNIGTASVPIMFLDVDGDGVADVNGYNQVRRFIGSQLP
jgi:hypothetical protein